MNADLPENEPCPCCLGSGSGIYNTLSPKSICEACEGTGFRAAPQAENLTPLVIHGGRP